jgi:hypothetical protein
MYFLVLERMLLLLVVVHLSPELLRLEARQHQTLLPQMEILIKHIFLLPQQTLVL